MSELPDNEFTRAVLPVIEGLRTVDEQRIALRAAIELLLKKKADPPAPPPLADVPPPS